MKSILKFLSGMCTLFCISVFPGLYICYYISPEGAPINLVEYVMRDLGGIVFGISLGIIAMIFKTLASIVDIITYKE